MLTLRRDGRRFARLLKSTLDSLPNLRSVNRHRSWTFTERELHASVATGLHQLHQFHQWLWHSDVNHHSISTFSMFLNKTSSLKIQTILVIGAAFCIVLTFFRPFLVIGAAFFVYPTFSRRVKRSSWTRPHSLAHLLLMIVPGRDAKEIKIFL
jgi:hypothetical protein